MKKILDKRSANLLREMVVADFKIRYQGSILGYLWSLLRPLGLFVILYIVFARILKLNNGLPHYSIYLLFGIMLWNYFVESTNFGLSSLVDHRDMIRKIQISKAVIVLASIISAFINLCIMFIIIVIFMLVTHQGLILSGLIYFIPLVVELTVLSASAAFLLGTLYVRYRDIKYIWELGQQMIFYLTPIIYPFSLVPEKYQKILALNPLAQIFQDVRYQLLTKKAITSWQVLGSLRQWIPVVLVMIIAITALKYFKMRTKYLAEEM